MSKKKTNPYTVTKLDCSNSEGHVWSRGSTDLVKLCLFCYQPKMVTK